MGAQLFGSMMQGLLVYCYGSEGMTYEKGRSGCCARTRTLTTTRFRCGKISTTTVAIRSKKRPRKLSTHEKRLLQRWHVMC